MKYFIIFYLFLIIVSCNNPSSHGDEKSVINLTNNALLFDGIDDKIDLFLKPLTDQWTLSAWVKGNDSIWNENEVIISNGWAELALWETNPLQIKNGYPAVGDSLIATTKLDANWNHLAVVNNGLEFELYINGELAAKGKGGKGICPSFVGSEDSKNFFSGAIDEVRIWETALDQKTIKAWMNRPLSNEHPNWSNLVSAYNFDDEHLDATDLKGNYHGDIKKVYSSKVTTNTPSYISNMNSSFSGNYHLEQFIKKPQSSDTYAGLNEFNSTKHLKVLTWNIWHGGIETGVDVGRQRVVDILKASTADVILMIETYGAAKTIADALGFHYYTLDEKDNLAIFSRYPIVEFYPSKHHGFYSLGAKVKLPTGKEIIVWDVWLRYCTPDYTLAVNDPEYTAEEMIEGDLNYAVKDIQAILAKDISHYVPNSTTPIILAGDFNSCSHLDWTKETAEAGLHYGKIVDFPTSKLMFDNGFKDSYREVNPNPVTHIGKTWSPIFNYCEDFRIDFIYYRGNGIKALDSRVIDQHPDKRQFFPSDHAGVLTIFEVE